MAVVKEREGCARVRSRGDARASGAGVSPTETRESSGVTPEYEEVETETRGRRSRRHGHAICGMRFLLDGFFLWFATCLEAPGGLCGGRVSWATSVLHDGTFAALLCLGRIRVFRLGHSSPNGWDQVVFRRLTVLDQANTCFADLYPWPVQILP